MSTTIEIEKWLMYKPCVENEKLVLVALKLHPKLLKAVDQAYEITGDGRTQFIRNAIIEKLVAMEIPLDPEAKLPPNRKGVGGRPTHKKKERESNRINERAPALNKEPEPAASSVRDRAARIEADRIAKIKAKRQRRRES